MCRRFLLTWLLGLCCSVLSNAQEIGPVGVVTAVVEASLRRSGSELTIAIRAGDLLYPGDAVTTTTAGLTIWFCPTREEVVFGAQNNVLLEKAALRIRVGPLNSRRPLAVCELPGIPQGKTPAFSGRRLSRIDAPVPAADLSARLAELPPPQRAQAEQDLRAINQILASDSSNPAALAVRGAILRRNRIHQQAALDYGRAGEQWNSVDWPRALVHEEESLERQLRSVPSTIAGAGKIYALVIGVSQYANLASDEQLQYADQDAISFARFLQSAKGGSIPESNIQLLTNQQATVSAIRTAIATSLQAKAGKQDAIILFLAAHGVVDSRGAYILGSDSHPEDLRNTALPMKEVQKLLGDEFANIGKVLIFLDVCRAGTIGAIRENRVSRVVGTMLDGAETYGLLASGPGESSWESDRFGGGHGAFSYFLLRAMNGDGDTDGDRRVTAEELFDYVYRNVRDATKRKQNPRVTGGMTGSVVMVADTMQSGIELTGWKPIDSEIAQARQGPKLVVPGKNAAPQLGSISTWPEAGPFERALSQGRLLPSQAKSAFELLQPLRRRAAENRLDYLSLENQLWVRLLDQGQQVLLQYLRGDELVPRREEFELGQQSFRAALQLDPEAWALESRALFCEGRKLIFDKRYAEAIGILERAVRIDPNGAYIYNALGIAYLELSNFSRAAAAFRDAVRLAPLWIYPQHNLALTLGELAEYEQARTVLAQAQRLAPAAWYLPYTKGLIEQRSGQLKLAVRSYQVAAGLAPQRPEAWNALGYLEATRGNAKAAERLYGEALGRNPGYVPARHNIALIMASRSPDRPRAIEMFRAVVNEAPDFLPSRLSLAENLASSGRWAEAATEYTAILGRNPDYVSALLARADAYIMLREWKLAEADWRRSLVLRPGNSAILSRLADTLEKSGQMQPAIEVYRQLLANAKDKKTKTQLDIKLRSLLTR